MAVFIPITGMKAEGGVGGGGEQAAAANQRRQLTVFTASTFSTIQPSTPPQSSGRGRKRSCPMKTELSVTGGFNGELQGLPPAALKQKIPRPPNAFMLFANDWRRKLASQFPKESNKDISIRLGGMWKNMEKDEKEKYFQYAREVDAAHKKKYPAPLKIAIEYLEQQTDTGSTDLLPLRRLHETAAKKRASSVKQKTITDFFKK